MADNRQVFFFIAQTGAISPRRLNSNFYSYTLPESRKREVLAEVERAKLGSGGLEYSREFLEDLGNWDRQGIEMLYR